MITMTDDDSGETHEFKGDELTSPEQQAIIFLKKLDKLKEEF